MRVLAIVPGAFCFGLQNMELALFSRLRQRMQCHFLNTRWTDGEFDRRLDELGIPHSSAWLGMFSRRLDWRNLRMTAECLWRLPGAWRDFIRLYRSFRPDLIYVANHHEIILLLPLLFWLRRSVVCHMHDPPPAIGFQKLSAWFWRKSVARFIFISHSARERMAAIAPLDSADPVIHNGVPIAPVAWPRQRTDRFRRQFGWPGNAVVFGIAGQINAYKGHEDLIEALTIARASDPAVKLVIGGRGDDYYVARLHQLIAARNLGDTVAFCGWLPDIGEFYAAVDVIILASRYEEGFGLVIAEAGERGLPAIATRSGGATEVVIGGEMGFVVDKQAPRQLAEAMLRLSGDADLRATMGRRARERVAAVFDLTIQADRMAVCLEQAALAGRR